MHGTDGSRAPSPNDTPTVFRPSPSGSAAEAVGANDRAQPLVSDGSHG